MNNILHIRRKLGMTQSAFGEAIKVSQGNVSHYEQRRQEVPPDVARRVIDVAAEHGYRITFDDIYRSPNVEEAA